MFHTYTLLFPVIDFTDLNLNDQAAPSVDVEIEYQAGPSTVKHQSSHQAPYPQGASHTVPGVYLFFLIHLLRS